jgi:CRISPR/Cas system-associated protein Cas5 (RAMP superfamily)
LFDPNEKTKSRRILPNIYPKNAREAVKNLRESLKEDNKDTAKFRRLADSEKESMKDFMRKWTGQQSVTCEDSYTALVKVIRVLANSI